MDCSDQEDFVDLCSKLLKRVRKKVGDPGEQRNAESQPVITQTRATDLPKRRRRKNDVETASTSKATAQTDCPTATSEPSLVDGNTAHQKQPLKNGGADLCVEVSGPSVSVADDEAAENGLGAAQKVVRRMQQFKRRSPQKLSHSEMNQSSETRQHHHSVPTPLPLCQDPQESDQALAVRLQEELDREARAQLLPRGGLGVHLEEGGLFLCQLCHRDLSHMSPAGRTQHTNRCLDESEDSAPSAPTPAPPPPPAIPECPICGKVFKTLKSRSAHLKRCSSHMGVAPAVLLQALQRQAAEAPSDGSASQSCRVQTGGSKRKGPKSDPSLPVRKKPRKRAPNLDEDTLVALALSSSLLEREREVEREMEREVEREVISAVPPGSVAALLRWQAHEAAGRGGKRRRKKGSAPRPPPLLLVQDPDTALRRLQDRVAALLLRTRAPSPPTPTLRPSSLPAWCSAGGGDGGGRGAPLWRKSALRDGGPGCPAEFYTAELREFISPPESTQPEAVSSDPSTTASSNRVGTPLFLSTSQTGPSPSLSTPGSSTQAGAGPAPGGGSLPVGSQALADLLELAEEGMTLTQWGYSSSGKGKDSNVAPEADLCMSGFIPDDAHSQRDDSCTGRPRDTQAHGPQRRDVHTACPPSVALSRLDSDLGSMVNNPQLSDVQLQVDDGEVFFAHSFMLYARCPLLAQMVHDSGFGVQEEGVPAARRVLLTEVAGPAVEVLLHYLYTARCPLTPSLLPHLQELACRLDLPELLQLCRDHPGPTENQGESQGEGRAWQDNPDQELPSGAENGGDQAFMELLRSMWNEEEEEDGVDEGGAGDRGEEGGMMTEEEHRGEGVTLEDGETREEEEERVNEEEMEEIYEFAATQRKRAEAKESPGEEGEAEEEREEAGRNAGTTDTETAARPNVSGTENISSAVPDLDRSYSRLFSDSWGVYEDDDPPPQPPRSQPPGCSSPSPRTPPSQPPRAGLRQTETPCLPSSVSEVIDLSVSPPAGVPCIPMPGLSPGEISPAGARRGPSEGRGAGEGREEEERGGRDHVAVHGGVSQERVGSGEERLSPKRTAQGPRSASLPRSPPPPRASREPELIVLSDSSEEMEVDPPLGIPPSSPPPPPPPLPTQSQQDFTQIRPRAEPNSLDGKEKSACVRGPSASSPPDGRLDGPGPDPVDHSPTMDFSPEVSWLIPATPLQPRTSSSSTQTQSSMRRTRLFPKTRSSSSSSSSSRSSNLQTSIDPPQASTRPAQTEGLVSGVTSRESAPQIPSLDLDLSPKRRSAVGRDTTDDSSNPSTKAAPLHSLPQPHSSTPLHPDPPQPPALPSASPLLCGGGGRHAGWPRGRADSQSPGRTGLGPLRLSLSDSPDSPRMGSPSRGTDQRRPPTESGDASSSGSRRMEMEGGKETRQGRRREEERRITSRGGEEERRLTSRGGEEERRLTSRGGEEERRLTSRGGEEERRLTSRGGEEERRLTSRGGEEERRLTSRGGEEEEEEGMEMEEEEKEVSGGCVFRQSSMAMDEPPMAFEDSWGLNAWEGQGEQEGCFSLRMDTTGAQSSLSPPPPSPPMIPPSPSPSPPPITHVHPASPVPSTSSTARNLAIRPSSSSSSPPPSAHAGPELGASLLSSRMWSDWEEEEAGPLSQKVTTVAPAQRVDQLKTPVASRRRGQLPLVAITPLPSYSDMDTPDLKNKLNRFGVRPLPKRQMILKLKEIHQYTHQVVSSESDDEAPPLGRAPQARPLPSSTASGRPASSGGFKQPGAPPAASPVKQGRREEQEALSASQGSSTSSTAASEDSERSNPELCPLSDDDGSDSDITPSQASSLLQDRLQAARRFILSDPELYGRVLQYQPLGLALLQARLKEAGITLGTAKLMDFLDANCITFTTAKPGKGSRQRRRGGGGVGRGRGGRRKKGVAPTVME